MTRRLPWFALSLPFVLQLLLLLGCPSGNPPPVEPTPPPATPSPVCEEGATCGCWHQPPGQGWQKLPDCVTPPPVQTGCSLAGEPSVSAPIQQNSMGNAVNAAIKALRPDCEVDGTCLLGDMTQQAWQSQVIAQLRLMGFCAGQHSPSTDEIAVAARAKDPWEGFHIFAGDDSDGPVPPGAPRRTVKWSPRAYTGSWLPPGTPPPPTPTTACTAPVAPKVDRWNLKPHNAWIDATPQFYNGETQRWDGTTVTGYCDAIGFTNRLHCPARMECEEGKNNFKCGERVACEEIGVGGRPASRPVWRCERGEADVSPANPMQARCGDGSTWIEVCRSDKTGCARLTF